MDPFLLDEHLLNLPANVAHWEIPHGLNRGCWENHLYMGHFPLPEVIAGGYGLFFGV